MPTTFGCASCTAEFRVDSDEKRNQLLGQNTKCPHCGEILAAGDPVLLDQDFNNFWAVAARHLAGDPDPVDMMFFTLLDEVASMECFHNWQIDAVVECMLFLIPSGIGIPESKIRQLLQQLDVNTTLLASSLKRLSQRGICVEIKTNRYFMDRSRRVRFQKVIAGESPTNPSPKPLPTVSVSKSDWRRRLLKVGLRIVLVAILTGIGSQIGGWVAAVVTALISSLAAVLIGGIGTHQGDEVGFGTE